MQKECTISSKELLSTIEHCNTNLSNINKQLSLYLYNTNTTDMKYSGDNNNNEGGGMKQQQQSESKSKRGRKRAIHTATTGAGGDLGDSVGSSDSRQSPVGRKRGAVMAKRGRGRPSKSYKEKSEGDVEYGGESADSVEQAAVVRGGVTNNSNSGGGRVKKGRGRPRKQEEEEDEEVKEKRSRGRPKKSEGGALEEDEEDKEGGSSEEAVPASKEQLTAVGATRGRGRPPKKPKMAVDNNNVKKGRGRPKKGTAVGSGGNMGDTGSDGSSEGKKQQQESASEEEMATVDD